MNYFVSFWVSNHSLLVLSDAHHIGRDLVAAGTPGVPPGLDDSAVFPPNNETYNVAKSDKILGLKYKTAKETVIDAFASYKERFPELFAPKA